MDSRREGFLEKLRSWCQSELSVLLCSPVENELMDYLLNIESEKDLVEYLEDMVGPETTSSKAFTLEFVRRWKQLQAAFPERTLGEIGNVHVSDKVNGGHMTSDLEHADKKLQQEALESHTTDWKGDLGHDPEDSEQAKPKVNNRRPAPKQKINFVPLMSREGQSKMAMYLPGRHPCQCLAVKHALINNCVKCGRIVCSQEGSGPCLFCGAVVCTPEEEEWMTKDSRKAKKLREHFLKKHNIEDTGRPLEHLHSTATDSPSLDKALLHRNKLLEFDQTSVSRTKVIDDESDYFSTDSNRWLSASEREALQTKQDVLREQKYGSRRNKALTMDIDIKGKKAVEENVKVDLYAEEHAKEALARGRQVGHDEDDMLAVQTHAGALYNPDVAAARPQFIELGKKDRRKVLKAVDRNGRGKGSDRAGSCRGLDRLQDRALQEMKDEGACLSMHQPWASLLVHGIKKVEGRTWYSTHRGRLWIASTSQVPNSRDILHTQQLYMDTSDGKEYLDFPLDYPTGCLLGCVDMLDCLPQEDYRDKYTDGESESNYVFIVDYPQRLTVKFPVKGKHKIWKLDKQVHAAAKKGLNTSLMDF